MNDPVCLRNGALRLGRRTATDAYCGMTNGGGTVCRRRRPNGQGVRKRNVRWARPHARCARTGG
ncbi:hypothetical protein DM49_3389 [Burkholderia mallei]|nr:hypothetical protein DM49_3389 [Burkholderia mallei]KOS91181.1 hypothetical protein DM53_4371 [Burkholderia mallei]